MSETLTTSTKPATRTDLVRATATKLGAATIVGAAALAIYGAYGDPHAKSNQISGVPFLIVIAAVVAVLVFGVLVPRALRAVHAGTPAASRWAAGHGVVAALAIPVFWSGIPLVLGTAAILLGLEGRRSAVRGTSVRSFTVAFVLGLIAVAGSVAAVILGNTVLSGS